MQALAGADARAVAAAPDPPADGNMPPFLTVSYIIALECIFPSRN